MKRAGSTYSVGIAVALGCAVIGMYFIMGGCETSKNRSCVGALLALTAGIPSDFNEECRGGACPKRDEWRATINATTPGAWAQRRKCPKGGTYTIEVAQAGELDDPKTYRVVCSVHGDLNTAKKLIDPGTYEQLKTMIPVAYRPQ